jgi:hypothetical protein
MHRTRDTIKTYFDENTGSWNLLSIQTWEYISWTPCVRCVRTCVGENFQTILRIVKDIAYSEMDVQLRVTRSESRQINWTDRNVWHISVKFVSRAGNFGLLRYGSCPTTSLPLWLVLLWFILLFKGEIASWMVNFPRHSRNSGPIAYVPHSLPQRQFQWSCKLW